MVVTEIFRVVRDFSLYIIFSECTADSILFSGSLAAELFSMEIFSVLCNMSPLMERWESMAEQLLIAHLRWVSFLCLTFKVFQKSIYLIDVRDI